MYGLIGKGVTHSFSSEIHKILGNDNYQIFNVDKLEDFMNGNQLIGYNVTMPYKTKIIQYLNEVDQVAHATNSVNTVIKKGNKLIGYNTDYYGFLELIKFYGLNFKNKKVIIIGNGSVSNTVVLALKELNVNTIVRLARNIKTDIDDKLDNFYLYKDYDVIINSTPIGMYPHNDQDLLFPIDSFTNLSFVIDLIYNPLRTKLLLEAESMNIKAINGIYMLIMQAKRAHEIFFNYELPLNVANKIYRKILKNLFNIVFIGLPLSGKSKYAKLLETKLNKKLYDTDQEIENVIGCSIFDFFQSHSEEEFRMYETEIIKNLYKNHNCIISTGGGTIKKDVNINFLKQNGILIFLDKNPEIISTKNIKGRPLIKSGEDLKKIAEERIPLYKKACDFSIAINKDTLYHINEIKEKINEYISR